MCASQGRRQHLGQLDNKRHQISRCSSSGCGFQYNAFCILLVDGPETLEHHLLPKAFEVSLTHTSVSPYSHRTARLGREQIPESLPASCKSLLSLLIPANAQLCHVVTITLDYQNLICSTVTLMFPHRLIFLMKMFEKERGRKERKDGETLCVPWGSL